jgi:hypothetical protein
MSFLRQIGRAYVINRITRGSRRGYGRGYGYGGSPYYARRQRGRGGFFGPFPYYSRRTRGGSRVTVSGCCLPIPLVMVSALALGARHLIHR